MIINGITKKFNIKSGLFTIKFIGYVKCSDFYKDFLNDLEYFKSYCDKEIFKISSEYIGLGLKYVEFYDNNPIIKIDSHETDVTTNKIILSFKGNLHSCNEELFKRLLELKFFFIDEDRLDGGY